MRGGVRGGCELKTKQKTDEYYVKYKINKIQIQIQGGFFNWPPPP